MKRSLSLWAVALALLPTAAAGLRPMELLPVPDVPLDLLPMEARQQVEDQSAVVAEMLDSEDPDSQGLAEAFGELGKLYYLYTLSGAARVAWTNASTLSPDDFRWHYYLGVLHRLEGDLGAAEGRLCRALELRSGDLPTRLRLARVDLERGRWNQASVHFEMILRVVPSSSAALYGLGRIAVAEKRYEEAIDLLSRALAGEPEGSVIHHQLGMAHRGLGDIDRARRHLARNRGVAVEFFDPLMEQMVPLVRGAHFRARLGVEALKNGTPELAVERLRGAADLDPDSAWIRYNLAVALQDSGRRDESRVELLAALERDPDYRDAHFNLGTLLAEQGDVAAAARHFARVIEIDPEDEMAHLELAVAFSRLGDPERALRDLGDLIARAPQFAPARLARATLLAKLGQQQEALRAASALLEIDASDSERAEAHLLVGRLSEPDDPGRAEESYRAALELEPETEEARFRHALVLGRLGRFADSASELGRLLESNPENTEYLLGQSMAYLMGERYLAARSVLEQAQESFPADLTFTHLLARLLAACPDDAVRDGMRAVELALETVRREQTLDHAETLAMALAEVGRWAEAVQWQRRVVTERQQQGSSGSLEVSQRYLALYERRRPVRSPWLAGNSGVMH